MSSTSRRDFLKRASRLTAGAFAAGAFIGCAKGKPAEPPPTAGPAKGGPPPADAAAKTGGPDLVVVKGGSTSAEVVRRALELLGGMAAFVSAGKSVCIKPNASWDRVPGSGGNVHPDVLSEVIRACKDAGAREVIALDYTLATAPLEFNGLRDGAQKAGAKFIELTKDDAGLFDEVEFVEGLKALPGIGPKERVATDLLNADVVINMPVLKTHSATGLSLSLKNLMGVIYDRTRYHGGGSGQGLSVATRRSQILDQAIADLGLLLKDRISLTIVDATYIMRSSDGPRGLDEEDGEPMMSMVAGRDMVACDTKAAMLFGMDEQEIMAKVPHIPLAEAIGVGTMKLAALNVKESNLGGAEKMTAPS